MDLGMARTMNGRTTRRLADCLGMNYASAEAASIQNSIDSQKLSASGVRKVERPGSAVQCRGEDALWVIVYSRDEDARCVLMCVEVRRGIRRADGRARVRA